MESMGIKITKFEALLKLRTQPGIRIVNVLDYARLVKHLGAKAEPVQVEVKNVKLSGIKHHENIYIPCDRNHLCNCDYKSESVDKQT